MSKCECADKGIPEGYVCGKPNCPRVIKAEKGLKKISEVLCIQRGSSVARLPNSH